MNLSILIPKAIYKELILRRDTNSRLSVSVLSYQDYSSIPCFPVYSNTTQGDADCLPRGKVLWRLSQVISFYYPGHVHYPPGHVYFLLVNFTLFPPSFLIITPCTSRRSRPPPDRVVDPLSGTLDTGARPPRVSPRSAHGPRQSSR